MKIYNHIYWLFSSDVSVHFAVSESVFSFFLLTFTIGHKLAGVQERQTSAACITNYSVHPLLQSQHQLALGGLDKSPMRQIRYPHVYATPPPPHPTRVFARSWWVHARVAKRKLNSEYILSVFDKRIILPRNQQERAAACSGRDYAFSVFDVLYIIMIIIHYCCIYMHSICLCMCKIDDFEIPMQSVYYMNWKSSDTQSLQSSTHDIRSGISIIYNIVLCIISLI